MILGSKPWLTFTPNLTLKLTLFLESFHTLTHGNGKEKKKKIFTNTPCFFSLKTEGIQGLFGLDFKFFSSFFSLGSSLSFLACNSRLPLGIGLPNDGQKGRLRAAHFGV